MPNEKTTLNDNPTLSRASPNAVSEQLSVQPLAASDESNTSWIPLHPYEQFTGNGQTFVFDALSLQLVTERAGGVHWLLDVEHESEARAAYVDTDGTPLVFQPPDMTNVEPAGYITTLEIRDTDSGQHVYGLCEWTARGRSIINDGSRRYISAAFWADDETRRVYGYSSFGLVAKPATRGQRRIGLSQQTTPPIILGGDSMNENPTQLLSQSQQSDIFTMLAVNSHEELVEKLSELNQLPEQLAALQAQVKTLEEQRDNAQVDALLNDAVSAGKITPAHADSIRNDPEQQVMRNPKTLGAMLAHLPVNPTLHAAAVQPADVETTAENPYTAQVNRMLNIGGN